MWSFIGTCITSYEVFAHEFQQPSSSFFFSSMPSIFQLEHGKKYTNKVEDAFRMKIFTENKHKIASHNKLYATGQKGYKLKMNKYGDMVSTCFLFFS